MDIWQRITNNEFGRLVQGSKYDVKAKDTMDFINKNELPTK